MELLLLAIWKGIVKNNIIESSFISALIKCRIKFLAWFSNAHNHNSQFSPWSKLKVCQMIDLVPTSRLTAPLYPLSRIEARHWSLVMTCPMYARENTSCGIYCSTRVYHVDLHFPHFQKRKTKSAKSSRSNEDGENSSAKTKSAFCVIS